MNYRIVETRVAEYQFDELPEEFQKLVLEAKKQTQTAYVPYSNFHVGASVLLDNQVTVSGNNQENAAYPSGLCAERVTMFYANAQYPGDAPNAIAIAAYTNGEFVKLPITPCGACRQVLVETEARYGKPITVILYGTEKTYVLENIRQLLPLSFEKESLLKK